MKRLLKLRFECRQAFAMGCMTATLLLVACSPQATPEAEVNASAKVPPATPVLHATPVVIDVCGEPQTYRHIPQRAVTHDVNITEMFLFLGLQDKLVGYTGIPSRKEIDPAMLPVLEKVPNLSSQGMNLETIVGAHADFVFGGWSYGFRQGGVTPEVLSRYGIDSYVLSESCIRVQERSKVALEDTLLDLRNVSQIFAIEANAKPKIQQLQNDIETLRQQMAGDYKRPRVFVYDSGQDIPTTVGRFGMPHAMIEAAGGSNIFSDIPKNWPRGNWEDVIARDPEWIVIIDYGVPDAQGKIDFLLQKKELEKVNAIRNKRFFVMTYAQATPGPRNVAVARALATVMHPDRFRKNSEAKISEPSFSQPGAAR